MLESESITHNSVVTAAKTTDELEAELADARLLHRLSIELIQEDGTAGLYKKIVEGAMALMRSQFASMQMLYPEKGSRGKLHLLASSGFSPEAEKFWEWVDEHTASSCGAALRANERVIIPNFATCEFMQDAPTLSFFLEAGIFAVQSTPLYSRSGKLLGMISTHWSYPHNPPEKHLYLLEVLARQAADLIERSQTAEALLQSQEQLRVLATRLEEKVNERTRELQRSNEDLLQFAHVASHDLKEPVRKIRTFGLRLNDELNGSGSENCKAYLTKILESAGRMSTMIEGVLKYSSMNVVDEKVETVDLNDILCDIRNDLEVLIQQKEAEFKYDDLPKIKGVKVLIYQLFYNLINNSLKFLNENQVPVITIISSRTFLNGLTYDCIVVSDNGIGFDSEYNADIFQAFTRLNSKSKFDGTGLGLSLVKKIVERHQGTIQANGKHNEGAAFTIFWPTEAA